MILWTLTVDDTDQMVTSIHRTECEAIEALFNRFDVGDDPRDDLQTVMDAYRICVYIDFHEVEL